MENASDALLIAFAVFVFVIAITVAFSVISQAKSTSDYVLYYADETTYYDHVDSKDYNRTVSVSEVISTLYRYYKESLCVTIVLEGDSYRFDIDLSDTDLDKLKDDDIISTKIKPSTETAAESLINAFVKNKLLKDYSNAEFTEEFVEIPISGIYNEGEDGTEIVLSSGGNKVYVTYTLKI